MVYVAGSILERMVEHADQLKAILAAEGIPLIINDRVDVAIVVGKVASLHEESRRRRPHRTARHERGALQTSAWPR